MRELTFIVTEAEEGGFNARAVGHNIFTQADTRDDLIANARDAVRCHFDADADRPALIHLHYVYDQVVAL